LSSLVALFQHLLPVCFPRTAFCGTEIRKHAIPVLPIIFLPVHYHAVSAPWIRIQFFKVVNQACTQRIQMNIADKALKIWIFLADNRFVPVLKNMPVPMMPSIVGTGIPGQQFAHKTGHTAVSAAQ